MREETLLRHLRLMGTADLASLARDMGRATDADVAAHGGVPAPSSSSSSSSSAAKALASPGQYLDATGPEQRLRTYLEDVLVDALCARPPAVAPGGGSTTTDAFHGEALNRLSLYPSEALLFDDHQVPAEPFPG